MLSTGEEIRSPQRSSRSGPILAKMPCTICDPLQIIFLVILAIDWFALHKEPLTCSYV